MTVQFKMQKPFTEDRFGTQEVSQQSKQNKVIQQRLNKHGQNTLGGLSLGEIQECLLCEEDELTQNTGSTQTIYTRMVGIMRRRSGTSRTGRHHKDGKTHRDRKESETREESNTTIKQETELIEKKNKRDITNVIF